MRKFVLYSLAVLGGFFLIALVLLTIGFKSLFSPKPIKIQPESQIYIHLTKTLWDFSKYHSFYFGAVPKPSVWDIDRGLRDAAHNPKIVSAILHIEFPKLTFSQAYTLGRAIQYFRSKGKKIECYASSFGSLGGGLPSYFLASYCDSITLQRLGEVGINVVSEKEIFGGEFVFLKDFFDKWKITPDFIVKGRFKKAPEPFLNSTFSVENKEMLKSLIADIETYLLAIIKENRSPKLQWSQHILESGPYLDKQALEIGLIDDISNDMNKALSVVAIEGYVRTLSDEEYLRKDTIAVGHLEGAIIDDGISYGMREKVITPSRVQTFIDAVQKLPHIKAIILSINSPGGSALASEKIWSIIKKAQENYKIVVCMQRAAASGGYYISAPANYIVANPFSLTGSIGVFVGKFAIGDMLREFGINPEKIDSFSNASMSSIFNQFTDQQRSYVIKSLEHTYDRFIQVVMDGRKKSKKVIDSLAEGRVWTGNQALKVGLVDQVGTLQDAVDYIIKDAGLNPAFTRVALVQPESEFPVILYDILEQIDASLAMVSKSMNYIYNMIYGKTYLNYKTDF